MLNSIVILYNVRWDLTIFNSYFSDTMGNKGAFINLNGKDMIPKYITYEAVVSVSLFFFPYITNFHLTKFKVDYYNLDFLIMNE